MQVDPKEKSSRSCCYRRHVTNEAGTQLTNHIIPAFGTLKLTEINPVQVENWLLNILH
ncbi:MAG TPA: hypothetical protein ENI15_02015 [Spirochaetes bacterium]|nr:hypothetical protein [Spirochaetota bacterium]